MLGSFNFDPLKIEQIPVGYAKLTIPGKLKHLKSEP